MANIFRLQQTSPWTLVGVEASIRAIARAVAAEHTLALRAATKAASPRRSVGEVRAMYVSTRQPRKEGDVVAQSAKFNTLMRVRRSSS